jgi:5-methylcytosine-specific restriction endonuclease McrA
MTVPTLFKRCPTCCGSGETLPAAEFYRVASRSDGLSSQCRKCHHGVQRRYYVRNAAAERLRARRRNRRVREENRGRVLRYLEAHACVECGEPNPIVLEFHHVAGRKRDAVACLLRDCREWSMISAEIAKCVVLCANCHRRQTAASQRHYRARVAEERIAPAKGDPAR